MIGKIYTDNYLLPCLKTWQAFWRTECEKLFSNKNFCMEDYLKLFQFGLQLTTDCYCDTLKAITEYSAEQSKKMFSNDYLFFFVQERS